MSVKHAPVQTLNWSKCAFDFCAQNFGHWNPDWHQGYYERRSEISYSSPCILRIFSTVQNQTLDYQIWIPLLDSSIQVGLTLYFYFCLSRKYDKLLKKTLVFQYWKIYSGDVNWFVILKDCCLWCLILWCLVMSCIVFWYHSGDVLMACNIMSYGVLLYHS